MKPAWAVLISGRGSNLAALLELREEIDLRLVMSSSPHAPGLLRARRAGGIETCLTPLIAGTKRIDWPELSKRLLKSGVNHVFLAGFMKIVPAEFVADWRGRIVNLHPSLLPAYPGLNSIERAYRDGADLGLSVHQVDEEVDAGRVICQRGSLNREQIRRYSLAEAELLVHIDEQRLIKETVRRWPHAQKA